MDKKNIADRSPFTHDAEPKGSSIQERMRQQSRFFVVDPDSEKFAEELKKKYPELYRNKKD